MISDDPLSTISGEDSTSEGGINLLNCSRADASLVCAVLGGGFGGPLAYFGTVAATYFGVVNPLPSIGVAAAVNGVSCPQTAILCCAGSIPCALCGAFVGCCCKDAITESITCDYPPNPSVNEPQNAPVPPSVNEPQNAPVPQTMGQQITR